MSLRVHLVGALTLCACRDPQTSKTTAPSAMELAITADLSSRFGTSVTTRCTVVGAIPVKCTAKLADGTELPIAIENASKTEWGWHVDGIVIETGPVTAYVQDMLASVHVTQTAACGSPIQVIKKTERVVCKLSGGGVAFVQVHDDGSTEVELALDPAAAAARTELLAPDGDRELTKQSTALESLGGESDGEDAVDAGVR